MRKRHQRRAGKSIPAPRSGKGRFEVVAGREVKVSAAADQCRWVEVWEEMQAKVERLTGEASIYWT
jgi:hypothetical protein